MRAVPLDFRCVYSIEVRVAKRQYFLLGLHAHTCVDTDSTAVIGHKLLSLIMADRGLINCRGCPKANLGPYEC